MLKKIALATALLATASFATWDKFPVLEANKGQAEAGATYTMAGDFSSLGMFVQGRYTVIPNLELGLSVPFVLFSDYDGVDGPDGLENIPVMVRYQFMPTMNAFVDLIIPLGDEELADDGFGVHFGVQYSQPFGSVVLGTEAGFELHTQGDDEYSDSYDLNLGAEVRIPMGMVTPYVGLDLDMLIGEPTIDGDEIPGSDRSGTLGIAPYVGANIGITEMVYADVQARFGIGEDYYGEDMPIWLTAKVGVNF